MKKEGLQFIRQKLVALVDVALLYVVYSEGSSPGRQGFHMAVAADGELWGSVGGGIMEHKWVEFARDQLLKKEKTVSIKYQYHDKSHPTLRSGMICSGHQVIVCLPLYAKDQVLIEQLLEAQEEAGQRLSLSPDGLSILLAGGWSSRDFHFTTEQDWQYSEALKSQKTIHIVGGGHVSLALSELMHFLGFYIKVYEDRQALNTLEQNHFCDEKHHLDYKNIGEIMQCHKHDYVVIMTFGYRLDKIVLQQLLHQEFFYIGLLGSGSKIKTLLAELLAEGYPAESLERIFTPIGIKIHSKTPREIAVSIAAEIIRESNKTP